MYICLIAICQLEFYTNIWIWIWTEYRAYTKQKHNQARVLQNFKVFGGKCDSWGTGNVSYSLKFPISFSRTFKLS